MTDLEKRLDDGLNRACDRITDLERENTELLIALKSMVGRFGGSATCGLDALSIQQARAAIAKATQR